MNREVIDLGTARVDVGKIVYETDYLYIGDCDGDVSIKLGSKSATPLNPNEFIKITGIKHIQYLYITNTAQAGKKLVIYFEESGEEEIK